MDGLTSAQVLKSREENGSNRLSRKKRVSLVRKFFANFNDPMLKILLVALAINCMFIFRSDSVLETAGIAIAILIAVIVSTFAEQSSSRAFEKLQQAAALITVRVTRDGRIQEISIDDVVVGDIVHLFVGDKIPADGQVIKGQIEVDQSVINGESKEAVKRAVSGEEGFVYSGTVVTNGEAIMRVTFVGDNSFYGKMAKDLQVEQPKSPLKVKLEHLAKIISIIGYIGAIMVAGAYLCHALLIEGETFSLKHIMHAGTLIVSVIVMAVPEGLPMMITVVLASNMKHMMRDNVLVRKLNGIETAGSMNILFTDKTGTLTQGKLEVVEVLTDDMELFNTVLRYNNSAKMAGKSAVGGNFTDRILLEYSFKHPITQVEIKEQTPFSSKLKYMKTVLADGRTLVKGAPEVVLKMCKNVDCDKIQKQVDTYTRQAFRLLACAVDDRFLGLVAIRDSVRKEAVIACDKMRSAGVQVVMITGDAKETAAAIARETNILTGKSGEIILTSKELSKITDEELRKVLPNLRVVARALPSDKSRLVKIAQSLGLVVGMTGDGVNDAPALKSADVGFAMGSGTEVAKEAGDIVIMDDNITSIGRATSYGRTIFKAIRKFLIFKLTINFVAMSISIVAPFLGIGMPITVLQMLWINIVMDTLAGLAYGGERPHPRYMNEPPKKRTEPIVNKYMWVQIVFATLFISGLSLWFLCSPTIQTPFKIHGTIYAMTAFFAFFMFINIFNSFNSRTHDVNLASSIRLNKPFVLIMFVVTVAQILLIFFGGEIFRTSPLGLKHFAAVIALALTILPIDMIRKVLLKSVYGKDMITT
jgi:calcium-translocating P-type ATPase